MATRGHYLSYSELRERLDPGYLGYAVQARGLNEEEVRQYSEDLHRVWERIAEEDAQPLEDVIKVEIEAPIDSTEPLFCRPMVVIQTEAGLTWFNPTAYWGRVPDESDSTNQRPPWLWPSAEEEEKRRRIRQEQSKKQRGSGNVWFDRIFYTNALREVVKMRKDLVEKWLDAGRNHLRLASPFYEGLCSVLLVEEPEKGLDLYRRLKEERLPVTILSNGIEQIEFFLFKALPTPVVLRAWERRLDECRTDKELLEVVVVAGHGNGKRWLNEVCDRDLVSGIIWKRARALILLGLSSASRAREILKENAEREPACWLTEVAREAEKYRRSSEWAQHQYLTFINAEDDIQAWAAFRLFLRCVDRRLLLWWPRFEELSPELPSFGKRRAFFENNRDTLKNRIRENETPLEKLFLGTKIRAGEVEPWLEEM